MFKSFNQARIVYSINNTGEKAPVYEPVVLGRAEIMQDRIDPTSNFAKIDKSNLLKGLLANPITNLVIELQVPKPKAVFSEIRRDGQ